MYIFEIFQSALKRNFSIGYCLDEKHGTHCMYLQNWSMALLIKQLFPI